MSTNSQETSISPYFEQFRRDVISVVPSNVKNLLSVGCAAGLTEAELVKRGVRVVGVEINPEAAKIAKQRGLIVLEGDASEVDVRIDSEYYDCLVYADVLEHIPRPLRVLKRHIEHLKSGGVVYVCVPNFRHYSVFWQLFIRGGIKYVDAGILDETHLRITTRKMVLEWFKQTGIEVLNIKYIIHRRRDKLISSCLFGLANEFFATQIGIIGKKR